MVRKFTAGVERAGEKKSRLYCSFHCTSEIKAMHIYQIHLNVLLFTTNSAKRCKSHRGARWLSGRASDSGARVRGLKVLIIPRKRWLRPDMTEK